MSAVSMQELARARETVGALLEALGLEAYLFEVEPRDGQWLIRVECAVAGGWTSRRLTAAADLLQGGAGDGPARRALLQAWREALAPCLRGR